MLDGNSSPTHFIEIMREPAYKKERDNKWSSYNYVLGQAEWTLILVILVSAVLGFSLSATLALVKIFALQKNIRALQKGKTGKES